jgi:glycosyltransferase involved in cell wall biosynthesis
MFALGLVQALEQSGESAVVAALTPGPPTDSLDVPVIGARRRSLKTIRDVRRLAKRADVVVSHGSSTLEAAATALVGSGVPFVYRTIGDPSFWAGSGHRRRTLAALHRRATRHVALWTGAARDLERLYGIGTARVDVIPNAVRSRLWQVPNSRERGTARSTWGVSPNHVCLAYVGALSSEKNVETALILANQLDAVLLIAGDGPERTRLEAQAVAFGGDIRFLGVLPCPRPVYAAADLLLLPSRSEGMPGVVIEAGLMGTPAVATAVGAVPEMLGDDRFGFVAPADDRLAFCEKVVAALPRSRTVGNAAAVEFRLKYTYDQVAPAWMRTLERATA